MGKKTTLPYDIGRSLSLMKNSTNVYRYGQWETAKLNKWLEIESLHGSSRKKLHFVMCCTVCPKIIKKNTDVKLSATVTK